MTPTSYLGVRLAKMDPQQRRVRLRWIVGEQLTAIGRKHSNGCPNGNIPCDHGTPWTGRELDGITYTMWKLGRADSAGHIIGGPNDGGEA